MYFQMHGQMKKMLGQLITWLDKAEAHAKAKSFDVNAFVKTRLVVDQLPLSFQIQNACDTAKLAASRMTGKEAPAHPDTEKTVDELRARVKSVIAFLETISEKDYEGAGDRIIRTPRWEGKVAFGRDYYLEHAVPNFFFHVTHAYAILRANGVDVGKGDYLGAQTRQNG